MSTMHRAILYFAAILLLAPAAVAQRREQYVLRRGVSRPLRELATLQAAKQTALWRSTIHMLPPPYSHSTEPDQLIDQSENGSDFPAVLARQIDGVGNGFSGPQGQFTVPGVPPDPNGAVGATQFVQWVNTSYAVFDKKTGKALLGPIPGNALWTGFGGGCEQDNDGDPIVLYDKLAKRWVMTQFAWSSYPPFEQCFAISQTSDAAGSYYLYSLELKYFNDYTKIAAWPDAYYVSFNMFSAPGPSAFLGAKACALDRSRMLQGLDATAQCFQLLPSFSFLLPSDLDGSQIPPLGSPNYYLNLGIDSLRIWHFHIDWANRANSTFGTTNHNPNEVVSVVPFYPACRSATDFVCIPQRDTSQLLASLGDRPMYRLVYRNFGDHETLLINHSVDTSSTGGRTGVRWYEMRRSSGENFSVYQHGTYAPADGNYRWMGSIAMDNNGDIAMGYSVSSPSSYPEIRIAGRRSADRLGTMSVEATVIAGSGSQLGNADQQPWRWGDYTSMSMDPTDDCTFWYTDEYLPENGVNNWKTRIASFRFPACGKAATENVLYSFKGADDGSQPVSSLVLDGSGNLYGTTEQGGLQNSGCLENTCGVVFQLDTTGHETVLHRFTGGPDGANPVTNVLRDSAGNLSGTTFDGGTQNCFPGCGVVFQLLPSGDETVLYSFNGFSDGANPQSSLLPDSNGDLFGTTSNGGANLGGTLFELDPSGNETVLVNFGGTAGDFPTGSLTADSSGSIYGTTVEGGSGSCQGGCGVVFKLDSSHRYTVLHSFTGGADGSIPKSGVIADPQGNLYGTTYEGGNTNCVLGCGVVFRIDPNGKQTILHSFSGGSADGAYPSGGLILDSAGNLYGTTTAGGKNGWGTIFSLNSTGTETILYSFKGGSDGASPQAGVVMDVAGNLYGTTQFGGSANAGTVYKLSR